MTIHEGGKSAMEWSGEEYQNSERIMTVKVNLHGEAVNVISVYSLQRDLITITREEFWEHWTETKE